MFQEVVEYRMANKKVDFDALLRSDTRAGLQAALARWPAPLTLPQAQQLCEHARSLAPTLQPLRLAIVHTYTSDLMQPWLAMNGALAGLDVQTYHAPYGLALQEAAPNSALLASRPDITLLMLQREDLHPDLARPIVGLGGERLAALHSECLTRIQEIVELFRAQEVGQLVLTLLPPLASPCLGLYDMQCAASETVWWSALHGEITAWMRQSSPASMLLDLDEVMRQMGRESFFDRRYWYSARFPFSPLAAMELARRIAAIGVLLKTPRAKVLVLDADNTLWGGVVGEDGIEGIALGPEYPGNAYLDFQRRILDFQHRGLILALCSKNNAADVDQVLSEHPHQILRDGHFAARRVNWLPKTENLISLAEELNLGLESFVFVDDSAHECAAVRHALPQVETIQVPSRPVDVPTCLDRVARLEVLSLTDEDRTKTEMYAQERRRRELSDHVGHAGGGLSDYLSRLMMKMRVNVDPLGHLSRLSQLTKKTNQFNLTTRRYDEQQMRNFIEDDHWLVLDFSLADVFGDSGIVGLAIWRIDTPERAELDSFLMSCRVIGRQAESAFLHVSMKLLAERGIVNLVADYLPTPKNELVRNFLAEQGFSIGKDGRHHRRLTDQPPHAPSAFPIEVTVVADELRQTGVFAP